MVEQGGSPPLDETRNPRAFRIETTSYNGREMHFAFLESHRKSHSNGTVPEDWADQISAAMNDASLVFVEYFPPELDETVSDSKIFGLPGRFYRRRLSVNEVYGRIAELAEEKDTKVAVADIANRPRFEAYHIGSFVWPFALDNFFNLPETDLLALVYFGHELYQNAFSKGVHHPEKSKIEKLLPHVADARRMLTARGMIQEADRAEDGAFLFIGAPGHASRVKKFVEEGLGRWDRTKVAMYKKILLGLDKRVRIYEPTEDGWTKVSNEKIR